jgi:rubrerythrin
VPHNTRPASLPIEHSDSVFAGKSMAYLKYLYFAKRAREAGAVDIAGIFEETAAQDVLQVFAHLDLLYPKERTTPAQSLEIAIEGETYEYTEMYPKFRNLALSEGKHEEVAELDRQIEASKQHATDFKRILEVAAQRCAYLTQSDL